MKVLILNGSPHPDGNTAIGLREAEKELQAAGMETEWVTVGNQDIRGCIACGYCKSHGSASFTTSSMNWRLNSKKPTGCL